MNTLTIAITGLNAIDNPGSGVPVIRALKESTHFDCRIIGLAYENLEPGIYMRDLVDKSYQIPYPSVGHETLFARLAYIHSQENIDIIIPNFDAELFSFIKMSPQLAELGIKTFLPTITQFEERLKGNLSEFGYKYDIPVPKSIPVYTILELEQQLMGFQYPVAIKGKFYDAAICNNIGQARDAFYKIGAEWGTPIIIQQFIKGQELNVTAIGDGKGNLIGAIPMRKTYITKNGKGWAGISIADEDLLETAQNIIENTEWRGGLELELIKEENTGIVYLIEINPRFPAWIYLAQGCGQNHPEALVRMAMGENVEPFEDYEAGKMFIRYSFDMICDLKDFEKMATLGEL